MNNITDWIKYELYPSLFESIDKAFPEHEFKRFSGGWRSKTYLNGSAHSSRQDKVVITKKAPGHILEQGGEVLGIIDYVMQRDSVEFITAVEILANHVGLAIPETSNFNQEAYTLYKDRLTILEECNNYFTFCLEHSKEAEKERIYLSSRGYTPEDVKSMGLGVILSQDQLLRHLENKKFSKTAIQKALKIDKDTRVGSSHRLTIPYRSGGNIKGFKFRSVTGETPKYLNSSGLDINSGFFNLLGIRGDKDVIVVEGELDALHASIRDTPNVVAAGSSSISPDQVKDAIRRGAKKFTLCFDYESGKEVETHKKVNSAIQVILDQGINRIYIAQLPDIDSSKTDPDSLIKTKGVEAFWEAIRKAPAYYEYKLNHTFQKFLKIEEDRGEGEITSKEKDSLLEEVVETASGIKDPIDRDQYKRRFLENFETIGITEESFNHTVEKITFKEDKEAQKKDFSKLLSEANQLHGKGSTDKALKLLQEKVKEVRLRDRATEFNELLVSTKETEIKERLKSKPESLSSGFVLEDEELLLPAGAITIFAAPTSHGKTTKLINTALNVAERYQDKEILFFSYEEDRDSILLNALNTYLGEDLSYNNRKTLKSYFKSGSTQFIKAEVRDFFKAKKDLFFSELIERRRLNINYSSYDSDTLIEAIRYLHKNTSVGAVFIDYIQLLNLPKGKYKTYSRQEEIKEICIALKDLAVETGLPIILGAQFNRTVVNHLHLHPTKIGEAGDIERIANLIVGFWNNNFKIEGTDGEKAEIIRDGINEPGTIYTKVLKNRGGVVGTSDLLSFNGNTGKIANADLVIDNPF